jgi:hydrogenase-4 membrane subunit HyfE
MRIFRGGFMESKIIVCLAAAVILVLVVFVNESLAYIDPGTGSFMLQLALAALFGALFFVKGLWAKVKARIKRLFTRSDSHN